MVGKICTVCRRCSLIDTQLSFFTYPGDKERRHEWLKAVDRMDLMDKVDNHKTRGNHRICEVHFEKKYIRRSDTCEGRKSLSKDAFPTLCLTPASKVIPMATENYEEPFTFSQDIIWREYQAVKTNNRQLSFNMENKEGTPVRRSNRQQEIAQKKNAYCYPYNELDIKDSSRSSSYDDISQLCESVIKVSKSTQTFVSGSIRRKHDIPDEIQETETGELINQDKKSFLQMCSTFLPPSLYKVVKLNLLTKNTRQNKKITLFAMNLYYSSNSYSLLNDLLSLPTKDTLKYFLLPKSTRLSENLINAFKCKVNNMSTKERVCSFSVGSILLKPNLYYDIKHDRMIGFHDVNGEQNVRVAKYAVLIMVQGILENWRQPVSYAFISEYDHFPEISAWIDEILTTLLDIGLDIRAFVSDPRSEFLYTSESRFVTTDKTYFTINGTDIFYTYDTTQLLKVVKNNLKSCYFDFGPDSKTSNNNDFFKKLNDLCDVLNAKTLFTSSPYKRAFANKKYQKDFLNEMSQLFQNLTVVRKADGVDVTENMKFVEGFQITIKSILQLFEELSFLGIKSLITSRLNHNSLNKFYAKIKPLNSKEECTPREFNKAFVRSFVFDMLKKPMGDVNSGNCSESEDFSKRILDDEFQEMENTSQSQPLSIQTTDYRANLPEKNAFVYVCGYCYLKCIQRHQCFRFKSYLNDNQRRLQKGDVFVCGVNLDLDVSDCVMMPPDEFTEFLMLLETKFREYLKPEVSISNIGHEIMNDLQKYQFGMPCPCFPIYYLIALFIRIRLFYTVRKNNRLLNRKKGVKMIRPFFL